MLTEHKSGDDSLYVRDGWYAVVSWGPHYDGPCGPYRSYGEAREALGRWSNRKGAEAGTIMAAASVRIYGPYGTRAAARKADISTHPNADN